MLGSLDRYSIYPGSHYVTPRQQLDRSIAGIREELKERLEFYDREGRFLEKQRIQQRTMYDLEMLEQMGFVQGIENYSRHLSQRKPGEPPPTLIDYFPKDFLLVMDESHQTVPQVGAMYRGDRSRKETLVEYGFRLPSALDNRPLKFEEFEQHMGRTVFVSATPGEYELKKSDGVIVALGGYGGASLAVRAGGRGDVTDTHRIWHQPKGGSWLGTGVIDNAAGYICDMGGVLHCLDVQTGNELWKGRSAGGGTWSSITQTDDGRMFLLTKAGTTTVFQPNRERLQLLAQNKLDEPTNASVVVAGDDLLIRTDRALWSFGDGSSAKASKRTQ